MADRRGGVDAVRDLRNRGFEDLRMRGIEESRIYCKNSVFLSVDIQSSLLGGLTSLHNFFSTYFGILKYRKHLTYAG
jgi:hypothetical protein